MKTTTQVFMENLRKVSHNDNYHQILLLNKSSELLTRLDNVSIYIISEVTVSFLKFYNLFIFFLYNLYIYV